MRWVSLFGLSSAVLNGAMPELAWADARWTIESGLVAGGALGVEGATHSPVRGVVDFGFLLEPDGRESRGWGLTLHGALGKEDMRLGVRPRVRIPLSATWAVEGAAGVLLAAIEGDPRVSPFGFTGGLSFQYKRVLSLRSDLQIVHVDEWQTVHRNVPRVHPEGNEVSLYGGVAFRDWAGWTFTALGVAGFLALTALILSTGID